MSVNYCQCRVNTSSCIALETSQRGLSCEAATGNWNKSPIKINADCLFATGSFKRSHRWNHIPSNCVCVCVWFWAQDRSTHLPGLRLAVAQLCHEVLAVVTGDGVRQLLTHQPTRVPHDDVALARFVFVVQVVVDPVAVVADHLPQLLAPDLRRSALREHQKVEGPRFVACVVCL